MSAKAFDLDFSERFGALDDPKASFVSKVYATLSLSLIVTALAAAWSAINIPIISPTWALLRWAPLLMLFVAMFIRMSGPFGWAFLFAFVTVEGLVIGPIITAYAAISGPFTVGYAVGLTALIFLGLTAYVRISGKNFSYLGGFLWMATLGLLITGIVLMFFPGPTAHYIYSWVGAALFSLWILYDTSAVTREHYQNNNVVGAVLNLYIDIIQLFLFILSIVSGRNRD